MPTDPASLLHDRWGDDIPREDVLWEALMCCHECDHRMIDHDEVEMRCRECDCDQSGRGLSAYADDALMDLDRAMKAAAALAGTEEPAPTEPEEYM